MKYFCNCELLAEHVENYPDRINTSKFSDSELEEFISELLKIPNQSHRIEIFKDLHGISVLVNGYFLILYDRSLKYLDTRVLDILLKYDLDIDPCTLAFFKLFNNLSNETKLKLELR